MIYYFLKKELLKKKLHTSILFVTRKLTSLTSAGVNVSARRGETSGPAGVNGRHPELVPTARPDVGEPRSLLGCLRGIGPTVRGEKRRYEHADVGKKINKRC